MAIHPALRAALCSISATFFCAEIVLGQTPAVDSSTTAVALRADTTAPDTPSTAMADVTVRGSRPAIEIKRDRIVLNVDANLSSTGSTMLDVLSRAPGVRVDANDNIALRGKPGVAIWIDGKPTPLTGADLANLLRSMPAQTVDRVELITNPSARYDAAGSSGIIHIFTKREKRRGTNGTLTLAYGQGVYPKAGPSFTGNHRAGALNIYGGYAAGYRKLFNQLDINRRFYTADVLRTEYTQQNYMTWERLNHVPSLGMDYTLSKKTTVGVSGTGYITRVRPRASNTSRVDSNSATTFFSTENASRESWNHYAVNASLRHRLDTAGRELAVDADYLRFWSQNYQRFINRYFTEGGDVLRPDYLLFGDLRGITQIRSLKADYTHPLRGGAQLEAGAKSSYVTADNNPAYYDISGGDTVFDASRSNHFVYTEEIHAAYAKVAGDYGKWSFDGGLRAEATIATGDQRATGETFERRYIQLFPTASIVRHLNAMHDAGISLSRRIQRPGYQQLNPFKFFLDPTNFRTGNPALRPALTWSVEATHTYAQKFVTTFSYSLTTDVIMEVLQPATERPNESYQIDRNLDRMHWVGLTGSYPIRFAKWWNSVTNANFYYNHFTADIAYTPLSRGSLAGDLNTTHTFTLPHTTTAELSLYYEGPQVWGYYWSRPVWMLGAAVQKGFAGGRATLRLSATDLARRGAPRASIRFRDFYENFVAVRDTRVLTLSCIYRFGKESGPRRLRSGADSERARVGGA